MMPQAPPQNRHYPSRQVTGPLHDDFRILYDHVYSLTDKLKETTKQLEDMKKSHADLSQKVANGPSNTKIAGLNVEGVVPQDGQQLTYNAATGQIVWQ
jgi:hypothetical protein